MIETIKPPEYNTFILYTLGLLIRSINKIRRSIISYTSPRTFTANEIECSISYCLTVVQNWEKALITYGGKTKPFADKNIIEIGPGPDLDTGIIILSLGAESYTVIDKNKFISKTPLVFYNKLLAHISS